MTIQRRTEHLLPTPPASSETSDAPEGAVVTAFPRAPEPVRLEGLCQPRPRAPVLAVAKVALALMAAPIVQTGLELLSAWA